MECKYWILADEMDIKEEFCFNMSPKDKREKGNKENNISKL